MNLTYAQIYLFAFIAAIIGLTFNDVIFQVGAIYLFILGFVDEKKGMDDYGFSTEGGTEGSPGDNGSGKGPLVPSA